MGTSKTFRGGYLKANDATSTRDGFTAGTGPFSGFRFGSSTAYLRAAIYLDSRRALAIGEDESESIRDAYLVCGTIDDSRDGYLIGPSSADRDAYLEGAYDDSRECIVWGGDGSGVRSGYLTAGIAQGSTSGFVIGPYTGNRNGYLASGIYQGSRRALVQAEADESTVRSGYCVGKMISERDGLVKGERGTKSLRSGYVAGETALGSEYFCECRGFVAGEVQSESDTREGYLVGADVTDSRDGYMWGGYSPNVFRNVLGEMYHIYREF